jgi:transcriptional regulator with XRE-family HTH domain
MSYKIDFSIATSEQIATALAERLESIRLMHNMTQAQLAKNAGVSTRTISRFENGLEISLDTFIRVLIALGIQENLRLLLPEADIRPIERVQFKGRERLRASSKRKHEEDNTEWTWGDEK